MSHNLFDYPKLPAMSEALADLDTIPIGNTSIAGVQETTTIAAIRGQMLYSAPVGAYVGPDGITQEVPFGNFRIRMNPVNNATEISTIAGAESTEIYRFAAWGGGAFDNANFNTLALTSAAWTSIDPLVLSGGDDMVRYWISRSSLTDKEWYEVYVWRPILGKTCIQATRLAFAGPSSAGGPLTANAIGVAAPNLTTVVNGVTANLPLIQIPDHWTSDTVPAGAAKGAQGTAADLYGEIRREGLVGIGIKPSVSLHTKSFGARTVNHFGPAVYTTSVDDHTIRFAQGCPQVGINFHAPSGVPGQILIIVNSSTFGQPISANAPLRINGIGLTTLLEPGESITIQSIGGFWCVIDTHRSHKGFLSALYANAFSSAVAIGELRFAYNGTTPLLNLGVQSTSTVPIAFSYWAQEQFPGQASFAVPFAAQLTANAITAPIWTNCPGGGLGTNEIIRYTIMTPRSCYEVRLADIGGTTFNLAVDRTDALP